MENYISIDEIEIWTDIRGGSKENYVVLCAGGPGCCDYLLPVSQMIEDGYSVIRFEQRGCGRSIKDGKYDMQTAINDLEAIREFYGVSKWVVGGHSWGANLALAYALHHPDRTDAILYIAGNGVQNNREWSAQYHVNREKFGEIMPEMLFDANLEVNQIGNTSWREFIQNPTLYKDISTLIAPTLFICGVNDIRPNWPAQQIHALMSNSTLTFIDGAAHYIWLTHSNEMKAQLRRFLNLPDLF